MLGISEPNHSMKVRPGVELASLTDVGCVRENNEDSYAYWEPNEDALLEVLGRLAIVADGMGGYEGGQIASQIAVDSVLKAYAKSAEDDPQTRLLGAFAEAHREIQEQAETLGLNGMGTTCTAAVVAKHQLWFAHVGDSRLYLVREGELKRLTKDHTLISRLMDTGMVRAEDVSSHPQKHVLTAALGVGGETAPDFSSAPISIKAGDVILLCTDGLWGQVSDEEIRQILSSQPPAKACEVLCDLAKTRGGPDNITLQLMHIQ
jgi:protein phosphatase